MEKLSNVHPGEILEKDFLEPISLSAYALAKAIGVDQTRISQLIKGICQYCFEVVKVFQNVSRILAKCSESI